MKISAWHKNKGDSVELKLDYENLDDYDKVYIAKVFTDTPIDEEILLKENVVYGGTGFFFDKAEPLPYEIEHTMPDYHLYDDWLNTKPDKESSKYKYYTQFSIGYLTRKCFRKCPFCVNQNYDKVELASPLSEFNSPERKKICLLDDNFFGSPDWKRLGEELQATGKRFVFHQGLDERLLTEEKAEFLATSKYDASLRFAFDNIADKDIITKKIKLLRKHTSRLTQFYLFTGFDREGKYDDAFWKQDLLDLMERIKILMEYGCLPYVMRHKNFEKSPYRGFYINVASWANQQRLFSKMTLVDYCNLYKPTSVTHKYHRDALRDIPELEKYVNLRYWEEKGKALAE